MTPLIDADVLKYEVAAKGEFIGDEGEKVLLSFDHVAQVLDDTISAICANCYATEEPILFLTMDARTKKRHNKQKAKQLKRLEKKYDKGIEDPSISVQELAETKEQISEVVESMEYKPNFREKVAKQKVYKGTRKKEKPFHIDNLVEYMLAKYQCVMAEGLEADDLLAIYQTEEYDERNPTTVICSRDKDLRMVPGLHYGWECGKQREFPLHHVRGVGDLSPYYRGRQPTTSPAEGGTVPKVAGVRATGYAFFAYQLLVGDSVDNIPGLKGVGPTKAWEVLQGLQDERSLITAVSDLYKEKCGDEWEAMLLEQGRLLWMLRELDEEGQPVMWEIPEECYE